MKKIILSLLIFFSFGFLNNTFSNSPSLIESEPSVGKTLFLSSFSSFDYYYFDEYFVKKNGNNKTGISSKYSNSSSKKMHFIENDDFLIWFTITPSSITSYEVNLYNKSKNTFKNDILVENYCGYSCPKPKFGFYNGNIYFHNTLILKDSNGDYSLSELPSDGEKFNYNGKTLYAFYSSHGDNKGISFYKQIGNNTINFNFYDFSSSQTYQSNVLPFSDNFSEDIKAIKYSKTKHPNGNNLYLFSLAYLKNGEQAFSTYYLGISNSLDVIKQGGFLVGVSENQMFGLNSQPGYSIDILNENLMLGGSFFQDTYVFKFFSNGKLYSQNLDYIFDDIFANSSSSNRVCKKVLLSYPYNIPFINDTAIVLGNDDIDTTNNRASTTLSQPNSGYEHTISLKNIEGLTGFSGTGILNNQPFIFNPLNTLSRWSGFGDKPIIVLSANENIGYFQIDGSGPSGNIYGYVVDCISGKKIDNIDYLEYGKEYTIEETDKICIDFGNKLGDRTITNIQFGGLGSQRFEREVCTEGDKTYIDGEEFNGDIDNPGDRNLINQIEKHKEETEKKAWYERIGDLVAFIFSLFIPPDLEGDYTENKFYQFSMSVLEKIPGLGDMLAIINVSLPETPILNIDLPFIDISTSGKIGYQTVNSDLPIITDRLNISSVQKNEEGSKFISFILAILYILIRILLFGFLFYLLRLFWKFTQYITSTFFGGLLAKDGKGNLLSAIIFSGVIILIIGTLFSIFTYIAPILPVISALADYTTVLFSYFALSFFDYGFFAGIVNLFFGSITTIILIYMAYLIVITFARAN